jgi:hypothetical protein
MTASLFNKIQDALPDNSPVKMSEAERQAVRQDGELFYSGLGIASPKTEQDILKKRAEDRGTVVEVGVAGGKMQKARSRADGTMELIGEPYTKKEGTTINLGAPVAGVDENGKPVFFQPNKKGGAAEIVPNVAPAPKEKKENILTTILKSAGDGAATTKPAAGAQAAPTLPPAIASKLKAGVNTTLSDGSVWTLEGGKPKQIRPATADRFANDPAMKGHTLGPRSDLGHEVMDQDGNLIGHYA